MYHHIQKNIDGINAEISTNSDHNYSGRIGSEYNLTRDYDKYNEIDIYMDFTYGDCKIYLSCFWWGTSEENAHCDHWYDDVEVGSFNISEIPYNPYTPPSAPTYCKVSPMRLKPDQNISVSWSGESGGTDGINHFQVEMHQWRGGQQIRNYTRVSGPIYYSEHGYNPCTWSTNLLSLRDVDNDVAIKVRPRWYTTISCSMLYWIWL